MKPNPPNDARLLRQIRPVNLLLFGPKTEALPLESLNVLIGPNGAGKSNLIEARADAGDAHSGANDFQRRCAGGRAHRESGWLRRDADSTARIYCPTWKRRGRT